MLIKPINRQTQLNSGRIWGQIYICIVKGLLCEVIMIHLLHLPYCCVGVNYLCAHRLRHGAAHIPLSISVDVYAYALLLAATLLCMIACFIVWYTNRCCGLVNVPAIIWIAYS